MKKGITMKVKKFIRFVLIGEFILVSFVFGESAKVKIINPKGCTFVKGKISISADILVNTWPIVGRVTSNFGIRVHPLTGETIFHDGIDIDHTLEGKEIRAVSDGAVIKISYDKKAGYYVKIKSVDGTIHKYLHLLEKSAFLVVGQQIKRGTVIGRVGATGEVTGPHLHFGVYDSNGKPVNPIGPNGYLKNLQNILSSDFVVRCTIDSQIIDTKNIQGWGSHIYETIWNTYGYKDGVHKIIIIVENIYQKLLGYASVNVKIDTTPPEITLKQPQKIIFVPQSQWPNGSYKVPISYPVDISCDVKDNFAVNDIRISVDEKLIYTQYNMSISTFIPFVEVFTSTLCGWNKHTLTITATDLAGNTTNFIYTFYILPERIVAFKTKIDGSYLTPFWYILTSTDRPIGEIGQSMGYAYLEPWDPNKTGSVRWASLESSYIIPIDVKEKKVVLVRITPEGYLPGETVSIGGTDIISKIEAESVIYDYFDNVMWSGKSEVIQATAGQPPAVTDMTLSPPDPQKIDPVLMLYNVVRIKCVETPGGEVS